MTADRARLRRLQRLERLRAIAKQDAAAAAAQAEGRLTQLEGLAQRTGALITGYLDHSALTLGGELAQLHRFMAGLDQIVTATAADIAAARVEADHRQQLLAQAEQRRASAEDRRQRHEQAARAQRTAPEQGARRETGTGLDR